ncbi:MAG TPA: methylated-DNA--[protein]-cysteine S-methyltransferase, partial [Alphaproteobacteria bacterium]|nr:methylated-DNA--[protein]-cysteine S-methyltransferase [Alphaproteobacteria bacterium]
AERGLGKAGRDRPAIAAGFAETPFGRCLVGDSPRGVCHLAFVESDDGEAEWLALRRNWPLAGVRRDDAAAQRLVKRIFRPHGQVGAAAPLRAFVRGTAFQVQVWRALLQVRAGALVSYRDLAEALGRPSAARAVGTAVGRNPLAYLIPCHRVIRETGVVGTYRWGTGRKRAMVAWESAVGRKD